MYIYTFWRLLHRMEAEKSGTFLAESCDRASTPPPQKRPPPPKSTTFLTSPLRELQVFSLPIQSEGFWILFGPDLVLIIYFIWPIRSENEFFSKNILVVNSSLASTSLNYLLIIRIIFFFLITINILTSLVKNLFIHDQKSQSLNLLY